MADGKRDPRKEENRFHLVKSDDDKQLVFGWASVSILFNYGTHFELIEKEPNNSRSGYYYENLLGGGSGMDKYHLCKDADETLQYVG